MIDLTFTCETAEHVVAVCDGGGRTLFAFGGFGRKPGAFDTPIDATLVSPEFFGEPPFGAVDMLYLAVADYGNERVQIFDLHGTLVATLTDELEAIGRPCGLSWRAPFLEIEGVEGAKTRIHLGAALLANGAARESLPRASRSRTADPRWAIC
jgi:hypothetical protein